MKIKDCIGICNAKLIVGTLEDELKNFSKDTRTIKEGDTYIALKGEVFNGNTFFEDAFRKGAKTCILDELDQPELIIEKYPNKNIILVDNTLDFMMALASKKRKDITAPVIAITGSVGKTSTKNIVASVLSQKYKVLSTKGNLNTKIGLSLMILNYQEEDYLVLEMGMNEFGEIRALTNIAKPNIAIITNIGTSHIGNLGSRENILKAKLEILEGLSGPIIINNDNDLLHNWYEKEKEREIITFGIEEKSDVEAEQITYSKEGSSFIIDKKEYTLPVYGKAFIYNALVGYIIGKLCNIEPDKIKSSFENFRGEEHRMEKIFKNDITIIDDTYNASYDSVYFALDVLSHLEGRKIAVLGDILELGDYSEEIHRNIGKLIIKNKIDILITIGKFAKFINEEAKKEGLNSQNSYHFEKNSEAVNLLKMILKKDDIILLKASHGMNFLEIVDALTK